MKFKQIKNATSLYFPWIGLVSVGWAAIRLAPVRLASICLALMGLVFSSVGLAAPEVILKADKSWDGEVFQYPKGQAEITSVKLKLIPGKETPFHCHPIPTMGYIVKGKIEVETKTGKTKQFSQGESVVEVMSSVHRGRALGGPAELVVFYAGAKHLPTTVLPDNDPKSYCK